MNGFTSGTQALQGRTVNHDPKPWVCTHCGKRGIKAWNLDREGRVYDPRPEFAVLDNPILASFRVDDSEENKYGSEGFVEWILYHLTDEDGAEYDWTPEQVDHARRVLTKLAALS